MPKKLINVSYCRKCKHELKNNIVTPDKNTVECKIICVKEAKCKQTGTCLLTSIQNTY
jgi:phosphopantetheinyl transferase